MSGGTTLRHGNQQSRFGLGTTRLTKGLYERRRLVVSGRKETTAAEGSTFSNRSPRFAHERKKKENGW
jgi:hypothetical protein